MVLLTRNDFREGVFQRDNHQCVICHEPAVDAHHIIERRLFSNGGYYLDNGASLCSQHHIKAEETTLTCDEIRQAAGITHIILPEHLYDDAEYDKWGNIIQPNGSRLKGELFEDESVQKIIKPVLHEFSKYIKYPRTYHLPWSHTLKDDRMMDNDDCFVDKIVVVTLKMDGENTTMYNDYIHARSINSDNHESRKWVKGLWSTFNYTLSEGLRLCGENLYAKHSMAYDDLESYFYLFSVWYNMTCLSWKETVEYAELLGIVHVPVLYHGMYNNNTIRDYFRIYNDRKPSEGYVIRLAGEFKYSDFRKSVGKYVNPDFRQMLNNSHGHWMSKKIEPNKLKVL